MNLSKNMFDVDYFAFLLVKESKNRTMEIHIIVIRVDHVDFNMNQDIANLYKKEIVLLFIVK